MAGAYPRGRAAEVAAGAGRVGLDAAGAEEDCHAFGAQGLDAHVNRVPNALVVRFDGVSIRDPVGLEDALNRIAGVVTVGLFARRGADLLLLGTPDGVVEYRRP